MWKGLCAVVIIAAVGSTAVTFGQATAVSDEPQPTEAEARDGRELAIQFTTRFVAIADLAPVVSEFYFNDFIRRYRTYKQKDEAVRPDLYFAPGLDYDSRLLTEAGTEDWLRFYVGVNNFLLFGFVSGLKNYSEEKANVEATDLYPPGVIELLNKNQNLANMIVRKARPKAVRSTQEMRKVADTLERAVTIMREQRVVKPLSQADQAELVKVIKEDDLFKPRIDVLSEEFFGFPKNTRVLIVKTPIGLQLMAAREGTSLKIFWSEIIAE